MGCCVSGCAAAPHSREGWKCPILLQRKTNSFLLIWAWPSPKCIMHSPDGEHMEFFVLSNLLFWLPWVCQVAEWEQVRQLPSAEETHKSAQNCKRSFTNLPPSLCPYIKSLAANAVWSQVLAKKTLFKICWTKSYGIAKFNNSPTLLELCLTAE